MTDDSNKIVTILYELCQSLILSLDMTLENHEKFIAVIDKLSPITSRTSLADYFEQTKEDILKTTEEDREALQESIQFLETMKKQWEETTNKKMDITYN
mgnify:CR=1 FL=1|tara:strand:- start:187 stop:483 length:297 start_codon:yes stop_codon:yes gene_type:complete